MTKKSYLVKKMRIEEQLILELFKKAKDKKQIQLLIEQKNFNFDYFLRIINRHLIAPQALSELLKYGIESGFKARLSESAREAVIKITLHNQTLKNEIRNILKLLNETKIKSILMKGLSIDFSGLRLNRDIDILVHQNDLLNAVDILKKINYIYVGDMINFCLNSKEKKDIKKQFPWNNQYQLRNAANGILLELHTNLFERKKIYSVNLNRLLDNIDSFWERRVWDKKLNAYRFSNEDLLILMCMHNAIKKSLSANTFVLRTLIDIQNLVGRRIDFDKVIESAKKYNISSFVYFSLSLLKVLLKTEIPESVLNKLKNNSSKSKISIEKIHLKCFHSLGSSSIFFSNIYKALSPFIYNADFKTKIGHLLFIPILLPSRWRMAEIYNIRNNNPVVYITYLLNPLRWIYLILKKVFRLE